MEGAPKQVGAVFPIACQHPNTEATHCDTMEQHSLPPGFGRREGSTQPATSQR